MRETIQNANGKQFHAVSLSGGKDSTAMLLLMIERDMPIDRQCHPDCPLWACRLSDQSKRCGL